jgi:hypothetical protein
MEGGEELVFMRDTTRANFHTVRRGRSGGSDLGGYVPLIW